MIGKNKYFFKLQEIVFYLLVFLIPTQLGYHIWLNSSYVSGLRIDYLSLTIYLTDVLIWLYIFIFILNNLKEKLFNYIFKNRKIPKVLLVLFLFMIVNIMYSYNKEIALIKWFKVIELLIFSFCISKDVVINKTRLLRTFSLSLIFFCFIGLLQFVKGSTINGLMYLLGERQFNISTPGISLMYLSNKVFLRPYSTFSHPNSFAGYILISLIFLYFWKDLTKKDRLIKKVSIGIGMFLLLLCFSKAAYISLLVVIILYIFKISNIKISKLFLVLFSSSLLLSIFSSFVIDNNIMFIRSISERLMLSEIAGKIISLKPFFGIGLNNFISYIPLVNLSKMSFWFLQPVHNIFLLLLTEVGLLGIVILYIFISKNMNSLQINKSLKYSLIFVAIFITGFFDHYWITLQQNLILIFLILGLYSNPQIK